MRGDRETLTAQAQNKTPAWWLPPIIPATQETGQHRENPSLKKKKSTHSKPGYTFTLEPSEKAGQGSYCSISQKKKTEMEDLLKAGNGRAKA